MVNKLFLVFSTHHRLVFHFSTTASLPRARGPVRAVPPPHELRPQRHRQQHHRLLRAPLLRRDRDRRGALQLGRRKERRDHRPPRRRARLRHHAQDGDLAHLPGAGPHLPGEAQVGLTLLVTVTVHSAYSDTSLSDTVYVHLGLQ